jgi:hypothetical protein
LRTIFALAALALITPAYAADIVLGGTMREFVDRWTEVTAAGDPARAATLGECTTDIPSTCQWSAVPFTGTLLSGRDGVTLNRIKFRLADPSLSNDLIYDAAVEAMKVLTPEATAAERRKTYELILGHVPDEGNYDIALKGVLYSIAQDIDSELVVSIARVGQ